MMDILGIITVVAFISLILVVSAVFVHHIPDIVEQALRDKIEKRDE